jgi:hypothetical protein
MEYRMHHKEGKLESTRKEAEKAFLSHKSVVGIGKTKSGEAIVFFLAMHSALLEKSIDEWASRHGVRAQVKVIGNFELVYSS